jgi:hypothetical protein
MDINNSQPMLFDFSDSETGVLEIFPEIWGALEKLTSPELFERHDGLDRLIVLDAPRLSPLVAYLVATRIFDPDIELRYKVVGVLGKALRPHDTGKFAPPTVRLHLKEYCVNLGEKGIVLLLEVADSYPDSESEVASIINLCSQSGDVLLKIMNNRRIPYSIRRQAIIFIGRVGFLDAVPALEKLEKRLESRHEGQKLMPFAPTSSSDEPSLLPVVQTALAFLKEP